MSEPIEIRPATEADLPAIHRLECQSFPVPWRIEFFESELHQAGRFSLVAVLNDRLVGYTFSMWIFDEMHVNKIAVDPASRRHGIAGALMDRCFAFAREHRVTTMSLEVRESNDGAQAFYRHLGFQKTYIRQRYYPDGEAAVVMSRECG